MKKPTPVSTNPLVYLIDLNIFEILDKDSNREDNDHLFIEKSAYDELKAEFALERLDRGMMATANIREYPSAKALMDKADKYREEAERLAAALTFLAETQWDNKALMLVANEALEQYEKMKGELE